MATDARWIFGSILGALCASATAHAQHTYTHWSASIASSPAILGDVDGDSVDEIASLFAPAATGPLVVEIRSGRDATVLRAFPVANPPSNSGARINAAGDLNGDRFPEVLVVGNAVWRAVSLVGIPTGSTTIGAACAGVGGRALGLATFGGPPDVQLGNPSFGLAVHGGNARAFAAVLGSDVIDPVGAWFVGCRVYLAGVHLPIAALQLDATGRGWIPFALPVAASLSGARLGLQAFAIDVTAPNGWLTSSRAIELRFQ